MSTVKVTSGTKGAEAAEPATYRNILVPLSRPETVESLVGLACDLLAKDGTMRLVTILEVPPQLPPGAIEKTDKAKEQLIRAAKFAKKRGINAITEVVNARLAADAISELASNYKSDLILMGSSQRTVPQKVLFGNVIDNVLHSAPCDVIIFSYTSEMRPINYEKILVPTAGYKHSQRAMQIAITLEKKFGGHITTIFVGRESETNLAEDIMHKVKTYADMFGIPVDVLFQLGNVPEKIVDTAKKGDFSLVIIGSTERPHYYKVLLGSVADEIVNKAPCNVLVVRTKGR